MENKNINDEFAELFAMLNENSIQHSNKPDKIMEQKNIEENKELKNITICKNESKKMKDTVLNFLKLSSKNKKSVSLLVGSVVVMSLTPLIVNDIDIEMPIKHIEMENLSEQTELNDYIDKVVENVSINNSDTSMIIEPKVEIKNGSTNNQIELFSIGKHQYMSYIYDYMEKTEYQSFEKNSKIFRVPKGIMIGMGMQESSLKHIECSPGGEYYNGCAVGIMQIENGYNTNVTAYNYQKNENETLNCSEEDKCNLDTNIKIACMLFQKAIEKYRGNVYLAIQSHNYGTDMMDKVIQKTAKEKGISEIEVMEDYSNVDWMKYVDDIHFNPTKYLSNWNYDTYGDNKYLEKVLNYCPESEINYMYDNNDITFDLGYGNIMDNQRKERYRINA